MWSWLTMVQGDDTVSCFSFCFLLVERLNFFYLLISVGYNWADRFPEIDKDNFRDYDDHDIEDVGDFDDDDDFYDEEGDDDNGGGDELRPNGNGDNNDEEEGEDEKEEDGEEEKDEMEEDEEEDEEEEEEEDEAEKAKFEEAFHLFVYFYQKIHKII